jgi:type VI secretion system protein ImpF
MGYDLQMRVSIKKKRLSPPFMHAFRSAFEKKDSREKLDLRDHAGDRVIAARRSAVRSTISEKVLRREVAHDLERLVNSISMSSTEDLDDFMWVGKSVLNYGLPDLIHRSIDEVANEQICREISTALKHYEPRLAAGSIKVIRDANVDKNELRIRFLVRADLLCTPANVPVEFIADVELDSGNVKVKKL